MINRMMIGWFRLVGWEVIRGGELLTSGRQSPALTSNKGQFLQSFANNPPSSLAAVMQSNRRTMLSTNLEVIVLKIFMCIFQPLKTGIRAI